MSQIILNIIITGAIYLIIAQSFAIIFYSVKFFNLTHAIIITLSAYITYYFSIQLNIDFILAILFAISCSILVGFSMEVFIFKPLRKKGFHSFVLLVASLGAYIIIQNIISILWGNETKSLRSIDVEAGHEILGAYITDIQIITVVISIIFFISAFLFLNKTIIGLKIRAISSNDDLSNIFGIDSSKIILWAYLIGSALAAIAGILVAFDTDMTPTMGFNLLLYGIVAMIIGGVKSYWGLIAGSLLLATAQHLGAYFIDSNWMDAIAYIILILFLIWKPLGFSGKQLKKVEI